jgi:hypothetical protein
MRVRVHHAPTHSTLQSLCGYALREGCRSARCHVTHATHIREHTYMRLRDHWRCVPTHMQGDAEGDVEELGAALEAFVVDAAERNARNYSSMYQDAAGGRPTEVGYINGAVIRAAEEHGVPVPCNRLLLQQMRMLEALGAFEKQPKA